MKFGSCSIQHFLFLDKQVRGAFKLHTSLTAAPSWLHLPHPRPLGSQFFLSSYRGRYSQCVKRGEPEAGVTPPQTRTVPERTWDVPVGKKLFSDLPTL